MTFFLWSQFAIVCLLGAMSPGPSLALIIRNSINFNRMSGILAAIAHGLGICVYATVTVIVLEFILRNSETIFFVIQICGSLFLIILGLIFIFKKNNENQIETYQIHSSSFTQGFIIAIINPKILILLGSTALNAIIGNVTVISKARGKWIQKEIGVVKPWTIASFHPAFLMRQPEQKKLAWMDLKMIRDKSKILKI